MNPIERRESPRREAIYHIAFESFNAHGEKVDAGPAHTVNISGRGALVEMPRGVDLDGSMILWIMGPFHTVLVKGSVVHSRSIANGAFHVGVRLLDMIEGSWDIWEKIARGRMEESEL
ncbi:MAG: PilZ domain-containing protein [Chloroflexi bacterium]|nr:PilZ domain-containing protein [Chloroflexota bacterium]